MKYMVKGIVWIVLITIGFPLFCPKCKLTHIIDVEKLEIVIKNTEKQTFIIQKKGYKNETFT